MAFGYAYKFVEIANLLQRLRGRQLRAYCIDNDPKSPREYMTPLDLSPCLLVDCVHFFCD